MNSLGDFRYVTPRGTFGFSTIETQVVSHVKDQSAWAADEGMEQWCTGLRTRKHALAPGGYLAKGVLSRFGARPPPLVAFGSDPRGNRFPVAAVVGKCLFVHGALRMSALRAGENERTQSG